MERSTSPPKKKPKKMDEKAVYVQTAASSRVYLLKEKFIKKKAMRLPRIKKKFFSEVIQKEQIEKIRKVNKISLTGSNIPKPVRAFYETGLPRKFLQLISIQGFAVPTVVQSYGFPIVLSGRDLLTVAQTGTGKTLTYLLPGIMHGRCQVRLAKTCGPTVLIVVPTREEAFKTIQLARPFCSVLGIGITSLVGGDCKELQVNALRNHPEILIATPHPLLEVIKEDIISLRTVTYIVFDQTDKLLDMGFEPQIRTILGLVRPDRQLLIWSAYWSSAIQRISKEFLINGIHMNVGSFQNIAQIVDVCDESEKEKKLDIIIPFIMTDRKKKTIIFTEKKSKGDIITRKLQKAGWLVESFHGDRGSHEREAALRDFQENRLHILVATDMTARGIDVDDIDYVINYDFPLRLDDYFHQIGHIGRNGRFGTAYTFFTAQNAARARQLIEALKEAKQHVPRKLIELADATPPKQKKKRIRKKNSARTNQGKTGCGQDHSGCSTSKDETHAPCQSRDQHLTRWRQNEARAPRA